MSASAFVRVCTAGAVGRITLERPEALNALNTEMVLAIQSALLAWRDDPRVRAVVIDGAGGRAFCAGGDIRMLAESGAAGDGRAEVFWREEYRLNQLIARYPKPYVALIDGIVMAAAWAFPCTAPSASPATRRSPPCRRLRSAISPTSAAPGSCRACRGSSGPSWR